MTPDFITEVKDLGYLEVTPDQLIRMQIHDVDVEFIKKLVEKDIDDLSIDKVINIRIQDIF